jgi:hypothetical protein
MGFDWKRRFVHATCHMPTDVFIVMLLNEVDQSSVPYWIDADSKRAAQRKALRIVGNGPFKIVSIQQLKQLVEGTATFEAPKKTAKKPRR